MGSNTRKEITAEIMQGPDTRTHLFDEIESHFGGRTLVTYFTSFNHNYNGSVSDDDCDMLQSVLQQIDTSKGIVLMISTPGGNGLAAERLANICRSYSGTGEFWALVPGKAKSAGTMIALGASKILMPATAELGPVDPQIRRAENGIYKWFSADDLVSSYDSLMNDAANTTGPLEPYLMQLSHHDHREIVGYRKSIELAKSISVKLLKADMMKRSSEATITTKIDIFLNPKAGTLAHGRAIYPDEAIKSGLKVEILDVNSDIWSKIYELYSRTESFVSFQAAKTVESKEESFYVSAQT